MKSIGIVGLPNIGKSTLFNIITEQSVPAENFPFCTIDKNVGIVEFKDPRLESLAKLYKSAKVYPSLIQFVDIAGLVKGASKGEGLGNQFLAHIREVDLIMFVLRAFPDSNVTHVDGSLDPARDLETIVTELILKDLESVDKKLISAQKQARNHADKDAQELVKALTVLKTHLESGKTAYQLLQTLSTKQQDMLRELFLLSAKPAIFVMNTSYIDMNESKYQKQLTSWTNSLKDYITQIYDAKSTEFIITIDAKFLADTQNMSQEELNEFKQELSYYNDIQSIITNAKNRLDLINFFVGNEKDSRSFFLKRGSSILKAAEKIHKDLAQKFVRAEIANVNDLVKTGSFTKLKELGKIKTVGKDYIVQDGDYTVILATN